jgi:hypothetical protein
MSSPCVTAINKAATAISRTVNMAFSVYYRSSAVRRKVVARRKASDAGINLLGAKSNSKCSQGKGGTKFYEWRKGYENLTLPVVMGLLGAAATGQMHDLDRVQSAHDFLGDPQVFQRVANELRGSGGVLRPFWKGGAYCSLARAKDQLMLLLNSALSDCKRT